MFKKRISSQWHACVHDRVQENHSKWMDTLLYATVNTMHCTFAELTITSSSMEATHCTNLYFYKSSHAEQSHETGTIVNKQTAIHPIELQFEYSRKLHG